MIRVLGVRQATRIQWMLGDMCRSYEYVKRTVDTPHQGPVPVEDYIQGGEIPGSRVEDLFDMDGQVHVISQLPDGKKRHLVIAYPAIAVIIAGLEVPDYRKIMEDTEAWEPIGQVFDLDMKTWKVDGDVPIDDKATITRIVRNGDEMEVYAAPKPGTPFAGLGYFQYRLMSVFWHAAEATIQPSAWERIATDLAKEARGEDPDEEEEEDEEEDDGDDVVTTEGDGGHAVPVAGGGASAAPNGTTTPGAATS